MQPKNNKGIQAFVAKKLKQANFASTDAQAHQLSSIVLIICCVVLLTLSVIIASGSSTTEIPPEKYYDPTEADSQQD